MKTEVQKVIDEILEGYRLGNITMEEANIQLEAIGAGFHLVDPETKPEGDPIEGADEEGYLPQPAGPDVQRKLDMSRHTERANMVIEQKVNGFTYYTYYDELGYHVKSIKKG